MLGAMVSACGTQANETDNKNELNSSAGNNEDSQESSNLATVERKDGEIVEISIQELFDEFDTNEASFKKNYEGAKITFTDTLKSVQTDVAVCCQEGSVNNNLNRIDFVDGWCVVMNPNDNTYDLADLNADEEYTVTTSIFGSPYNSDFLKKTHGESRVMWLVGDGDFGVKDDTFGDLYFFTIKYGNETTIEPAQ